MSKEDFDKTAHKEGEEVSEKTKRGMPTAGFSVGDVEGARDRATKAAGKDWRGDDGHISKESIRKIQESEREEAKAYAEGGNKAEHMAGGKAVNKALKGDAEDTDANRERNMKQGQKEGKSSDDFRDAADNAKGADIDEFVDEATTDSKHIAYNRKGQWKKNKDGEWEKRAAGDNSDDLNDESQSQMSAKSNDGSQSQWSAKSKDSAKASATKSGATDVTESKDVSGAASMNEEPVNAEVAGIDRMGFPSMGPGPSKSYEQQAEAHLHPKK